MNRQQVKGAMDMTQHDYAVMVKATRIAMDTTPDELIALAAQLGIHGDRQNPWPTAKALAAAMIEDERRE